MRSGALKHACACVSACASVCVHEHTFVSRCMCVIIRWLEYASKIQLQLRVLWLTLLYWHCFVGVWRCALMRIDACFECVAAPSCLECLAALSLDAYICGLFGTSSLWFRFNHFDCCKHQFIRSWQLSWNENRHISYMYVRIHMCIYIHIYIYIYICIHICIYVRM